MLPRSKWLWMACAAALIAPPVHALVPTGPAQNLTPEKTYSKVAPRISPDGGLIVFTDYTGAVDGSGTSRNIAYKRRGDAGFQLMDWQMTEKMDEWAVAGPDNNTIFFHSYSQPNGRTDIWKHDLTTGESTQMTNNAAYDAFPAVSPDGKKMVFLSQRETAWYQLYLMDATKPENDTDNVPKRVITFPSGTGIGLGRMVFTSDSKSVVFTYKTADMPRSELYIGDAADTDNDGMLDNMRRLTDIAAYKAGTGVSEPSVYGNRVYFTSNAALDGTAKYHVYSLDLNGEGPNADIWQVSASNASEQYVGVGEDGMVVLASADASRGTAVQFVDYYAMAAEDTTPSYLVGTLPFSPSGGAAGYLVELWNGNVKTAETYTDSNGGWSFESIRPGGYFLRFSSPAALNLPIPISTVTRPVIAAPGQTVHVDVFSSPAAARRPRNLVPTIQPDGSVNIAFQADPVSQLTAGWTYVEFPVYRGPSESGPWTRIGTVTGEGLAHSFIDANPGDLTQAFYTATCVTTDGEETRESWYADAGQAANNLVFNPGFEIVGSNNLPVGWSPQPMALPGTPAPANENTWGATTDDAIAGTRSAYIQAANSITNIGDFVLNTDVPYFVPTAGGRSYVHGVYGRFDNAPAATNHTAYTRFAFSWSEPNAGAAGWYDAYNGPGFAAGGAANPSTPWAWTGNVNPMAPFNASPYTRLSVYWGANSQAAALIPGVSRTLWDEYRFQEKRVGATGIVWGRILDAAGSPVSGALVSDGEKTVFSLTNGVFAIRDSATGDRTITISYPGQPDITRQIRNIGGYVFNEILAFSGVVPTSYGGRVFLPNGRPAVGAKVTYVVGNIVVDGSEAVYEALTDANGAYVIDDSSQPIDTSKKVWAVAHLAGYKATYLKDQTLAGSGAGRIGFNITLGPATPIIEVARATAAPTIDGTVNPAEWANSQEIAGFVLYPTSSTPYPIATRSYALWDDNNLYVAMVADEPNIAGLQAAAEGYEIVGTVWGDDNFQVFLDPLRSAAIGYNREVWQIGFNTNANIGITDGIMSTGPYVLGLQTIHSIFGLEAANRVDAANNRWSVEAAIPWNDLSTGGLQVTAPGLGDEWAGMFARYRSQDQTNASTSSVASRFAEAEKWNTLRFVNTITPPTISAQTALRIAGGLQAATSTAGDLDSSGTITLEDAIGLLRAENGLN